MLLQYLTLLDGKGIEITRDYANKQLVIQGLKQPETAEEQQWLQEAQQQQQNQPDPAMVQAQGVLAQGQAEQMKAQNQQQDLQIKAYTAQQQAQLTQAQAVQAMANAKSLNDKSLRDALSVLSDWYQKQNTAAHNDADQMLRANQQHHGQQLDIANLLQQQSQQQRNQQPSAIPGE